MSLGRVISLTDFVRVETVRSAIIQRRKRFLRLVSSVVGREVWTETGP